MTAPSGPATQYETPLPTATPQERQIATPENQLSILLHEYGYGSLVITLERTACFGSCPIYTLSIQGDGSVIYEGIDFVAVTGRQETRIGLDQVKDLAAAFVQIDYWALPDFVSFDMTDMPSAATSISIGGTMKSVDHYYGDLHAPQALYELEQLIDEVAHTKQWIGD
jgi:hypothetical protein